MWDADLVDQVARALWEELNVPKGRNWEDHAVSAARIYWHDRAATAIAAIRNNGYGLTRIIKREPTPFVFPED